MNTLSNIVNLFSIFEAIASFVIVAGIRTAGSTNTNDPPADIMDFRFQTAPVSEWNLACLTVSVFCKSIV